MIRFISLLAFGLVGIFLIAFWMVLISIVWFISGMLWVVNLRKKQASE